jgi:putative ABC transport system permease protein
VIASLRHGLFLALRSLRAAPGRTAILVLGTTVALFLPAFTTGAADLLERELLGRADATPIVVGAKGNEFDLTMNSLYFRGRIRDPIPFGTRTLVQDRAYGLAVPLYVAHTASGTPVVGTSLEYFEARGLGLSSGRLPAVLGEVVAGSAAARAFNLTPGDTIRSDLSNLYNLAGAYPILLQVVGVLAPAASPDDDAFFADIKTIWVLDGALHGHQEVTRDQALNPQAGQEENLEATAAIFLFAEINEDNRGGFHLHGDADELPISSMLVFPRDARAHDQLLGDAVLAPDLQAIRPVEVVRTVLDIVLRLRDGLLTYFALVAASTLLFFGLVVALTLRLRRAEIELMARLGCSRGMIAVLLGSEVALIVLAAFALTGAATAAGLVVLRAGLL